ncbi:hypothetical protein F4604DRAFT_1682350 [Suillus subluteus]|nr:hypothetical protein F4604DRAFT_1682350 [Suillus subluteus]
MSSCRVHFSTPLETQGVQNLPSTGYNMGLETRIETIKDLGDSTPNWYDQACSGLDDYIAELSSMFDEDWAKSRDPEFLHFPTQSVDEEEEVDELADDDSPLYDLGWSAASSALGDAPTLDDRSFADDREDQGPVYDLGWGPMAPDAPTLDDNAITGEHGDQGPTYDLGWGPTMPEAPSDAASVGPEDDTPVYDLGWGEISSVEDSMDEDGPAYDLGWDVGATGQTQNVIDLTNDDGPAYDLGWGVKPMTQAKAKYIGDIEPDIIDLTNSSPAPMDLDPDDGGESNASTSDTLDHDAGTPAKRMRFRHNHRMKAISNDMTDIHMHALVENSVQGLNLSLMPGQILFENRGMLGAFADARTWVTDIGDDMCKLHRLIQIQRGLLKTVNHIIGSLEDAAK